MDIEAEFRLLDAMVENLWQLTPEELDAELIEDGIDPKAYAEEGREIMLRAVRNHYVRRRIELSQQPLIPPRRRGGLLMSRLNLDELRAALADKLALLSPKQQQLTLCHREIKELTLEDLRSTLEDLEELTADDDDQSPQ